ncbi:MAG: hypothetical protein J6W79_01620 [Alphaproteobacteria bacterium]|nr:hypothetical protein [Alphaproteobacteria bacterium]
MEKLSIIREEMTTALSKAGIIDKSGKIINHQAFLEFVDRKIKEKNEELASTEKDGVTIDLYHANMIYAEINYLEEMKNKMSVDPYQFIPNENADKEPESKKENFEHGKEKVHKKSGGLVANFKTKFSKMFGRNK